MIKQPYDILQLMNDSSQLTTETPTADFRTLIKGNKKQNKFIEAYLNPISKTFGNAYQSAVEAGFSKNYARVITANSRHMPWITELKQLLTQYEPEHIYRAMQHIAITGKSDRDKLRALELMGKHTGMFIERSINQVNVSFVNNVPRPQAHITPIDIE